MSKLLIGPKQLMFFDLETQLKIDSKYWALRKYRTGFNLREVTVLKGLLERQLREEIKHG